MKMRFLLVLLCACLLLGACTATPGESQTTKAADLSVQEPERQPDSTEPPVQPEKEKPHVEAVYDELPEEHSYYQYGNMQINGPAGEYIRYKDQVVFSAYGNSRQRRYAYDLSTGEVRIFCDLPGCEHDGDDCLTAGLSMGVVEQYDGTLYGHSLGDPNRVLVDGRWEKLNCFGGIFWHSYGDLFVNSYNRLWVYYGGIGEPKLIMDDYSYLWNVVFDGYLYGSSGEELVRVSLMEDNPQKEVLLDDAYCMVEGNHIYYVDTADDSDTCYLYRCDMDGTNAQLLLDKPVLPTSVNFDDEYVYFRLYTDHLISGTEDGKDIYRMSKADPTQIVKIATLPETAYQIFTVPGENLVFVIARGRYVDGLHIQNVYVMNTDGSDFRMLELP